jgi:membrane-associated HD superfamily phosphohydrolase
MKHLILINSVITATLTLTSCASSSQIAPSQNSALNTISKSSATKKKDGAMQKSLDKWLKNDWEPTIKKDNEIQKKYMKVKTSKKVLKESEEKTENKNIKIEYEEKQSETFTLQEYVDKASAYMRQKPNNYKSSNVKKIEALPVIGK